MHLIRTKIFYLIFFSLTILLGWYLVTKNSTPSLTNPVPNLQYVEPQLTLMYDSLETVGLLQAINELKIKAPTTGKISKLHIAGGSFVTTDTILASLVALPDIKAPFSGYINDWQVKEGELVVANQQLNELVDLEHLQLNYKLPANLAHKVDLNQIVQVEGKNNVAFSTKVNFIAPVVDKNTNTVTIKAIVDNKDYILMPGMSVNIKHIFQEFPQAISIPESCLIVEIDGYSVFIVGADNKLMKQPVKLGARLSNRVHVIEGLTLKDKVILALTPELNEGALVNLQEYRD